MDEINQSPAVLEGALDLLGGVDFLDTDLDRAFPSRMGDHTVEIVLPRAANRPPNGSPDSWNRPKLPRLLQPDVAEKLEGHVWGWSNGGDSTRVTSVLLRCQIIDPVEDIRAIGEQISAAAELWRDRLLEWLRVLSAMPYGRVLRAQAQQTGSTVFLWSKVAPGVVIPARTEGCSVGQVIHQLPVKLSTFERALALASQDRAVPLSWGLLASAECAFWDGDFRLAVVDAATAVEYELAQCVRTALHDRGLGKFEGVATKRWTLGTWATAVHALEFKLADKFHERLVSTRNDVVHDGVTPDSDSAFDAVMAARETLMQVAPILP